MEEQLLETFVGEDRLRAFTALTQAWEAAVDGPRFEVAVLRGPSGSGRTAMLQLLYRHCSMWAPRPRYWPADLVDDRVGDLGAAADEAPTDGELLFPLRMRPDQGSRLGMFWWGLRGRRDAFAAWEGDRQITTHIDALADAVARADRLTRDRLRVALRTVQFLGSLLPPLSAPIAAAAQSGQHWFELAKGTASLGKALGDVSQSRSTIVDQARRGNAGRVLAVGQRAAAVQRAEEDGRALALVAGVVRFAVVVDEAQLLDDVTLNMLKVIVGQRSARGLIVLAVNTDLDEVAAKDPGRKALDKWLDELQRADRLTSINLAPMTQPELQVVAEHQMGALPKDEAGKHALTSVIAASNGSPGRLTFLLRVPAVRRAITDGEQLPAPLEEFTEQSQAEEAFATLSASARTGLAAAAIQGPLTYASWLTSVPDGHSGVRPAITPEELDAAAATGWVHQDDDEIVRFSSDVLFGVAYRQVNSELPPEQAQRAAQSLAAWVAVEHQSDKWACVPAFVAESVLTVLTREPPPPGVNHEAAWAAELVRIRRVTGRQAADDAALSALEKRLRTGSPSAVLVVATAEALFDAGQTKGAFEVLQTELDRLTDHYGAGAPATFPALQNLAIARAAQARYRSGHPEAAAMFEHAISLYRQLLTGRELHEKAGDKRIPDTRRDLAGLLADSYQYQEATKECGQAIEEMRHCADYGPDHPDTLTARGNLAVWTGEAGKATVARDLFKVLLQDLVRGLGPDHPDTLTVRNNLATFTGVAGNAAGARDRLAALLPDQARVLGPDHPDTLTMRNNLASWTGRAGNATGAREQFEAVLPDRAGVLGPDHPDTLDTRGNLAFWTGKAGNAAAARDLFEVLLQDLVRVLGPDHRGTLTTRGNLAFFTGAGNVAGARDQLAALLRDQARVLGPDHPDTLAARNNLANFTGQAGNVAVARDQLAALLRDQARVLGADHPDTLATGKNLAYWTAEAGDDLS